MHPRKMLLFTIIAAMVLVVVPQPTLHAQDTGPTWTFISRTPDGIAGDGASFDPQISRDGNVIAFSSRATNLTGTILTPRTQGDRQFPNTNVYVYDVPSDTLKLLSYSVDNPADNGDHVSQYPAISPNGRFVTFISPADNLGSPAVANADVYLYDLQTDTRTWISRGNGEGSTSLNAVVSDNGRVVFDVQLREPRISNLFLYDAATETLTPITTGIDGELLGNGNAHSPSITPDGQFVVFASTATNIHPDATDGTEQVYLYDVETETLTLASATIGDEGSIETVQVSDDGRYVLYLGYDSDLIGDPSGRGFYRFPYLYDAANDTIQLIAPDDELAHEGARSLHFSSDGQQIVYMRADTDLDNPVYENRWIMLISSPTATPQLVLQDQADRSGVTLLHPHATALPYISADGSTVILQSEQVL